MSKKGKSYSADLKQDAVSRMAHAKTIHRPDWWLCGQDRSGTCWFSCRNVRRKRTKRTKSGSELSVRSAIRSSGKHA
jgi:hypothetical protein